MASYSITGVDLNGSIVITRYGGNFRGLKVGINAVGIRLGSFDPSRAAGQGRSGARCRSLPHLLGPARRWYRDCRKWLRPVSQAVVDKRYPFAHFPKVPVWSRQEPQFSPAGQHSILVGLPRVCALRYL